MSFKRDFWIQRGAELRLIQHGQPRGPAALSYRRMPIWVAISV